MVLFNLQEYKAADSLMQILAANKYKDLAETDQAKILVQEGYILYRNKNYKQAEEKYQAAIRQAKAVSSCDLPYLWQADPVASAAKHQPGMRDSSVPACDQGGGRLRHREIKTVCA